MKAYALIATLMLVVPLAAQQDQPQQAPTRVQVKGKVMEKMLVHKVNPRYPAEAMRNRVAGTVKLHVIIGVDGAVKEVEYVSGPSVFVQPTIDAVRQWKYKPQAASGQPVEVDTTVEVVFSFIA